MASRLELDKTSKPGQVVPYVHREKIDPNTVAERMARPAKVLGSLYKKFKMRCLELDMGEGAALAEALKLWLDQKRK